MVGAGSLRPGGPEPGRLRSEQTVRKKCCSTAEMLKGVQKVCRMTRRRPPPDSARLVRAQGSVDRTDDSSYVRWRCGASSPCWPSRRSVVRLRRGVAQARARLRARRKSPLGAPLRLPTHATTARRSDPTDLRRPLRQKHRRPDRTSGCSHWRRRLLCPCTWWKTMAPGNAGGLFSRALRCYFFCRGVGRRSEGSQRERATLVFRFGRSLGRGPGLLCALSARPRLRQAAWHVVESELQVPSSMPSFVRPRSSLTLRRLCLSHEQKFRL